MRSHEENEPRPTEQPASIVSSAATPDVVVEHDFDDPHSELTVTVVDAVANAVDVSPAEVVPRVNDYVDPDALDRIFRPRPDGSDRQGRLIFELVSCRVEIIGDGTVQIYET